MNTQNLMRKKWVHITETLVVVLVLLTCYHLFYLLNLQSLNTRPHGAIHFGILSAQYEVSSSSVLIHWFISLVLFEAFFAIVGVLVFSRSWALRMLGICICMLGLSVLLPAIAVVVE